MINTPAGWSATTLGNVGDYYNGRGFKKSEWRPSGGRPIIRIQNLTGSSSVFNYYDGEADERYTARRGDLLVSWAATLGAYLWEGPEAVVNQHIFKVRSRLDTRFHKYLLDHHLNALGRETHGSGIVHVTRGRFDALPIIVPDTVEEQRRIVAILEDHLSRLDAADAYLEAGRRRLKSAHSAVLRRLIPDRRDYPAHWRGTTVGEAGRVDLGRQRHPDWHHGDNMRPYLRVANVFEDDIRTDDVKHMHWPGGTFERFRLHDGDVLLNEGQTPQLVGRPALYRGQPADIAFTNSLIRFRAHEAVAATFALLVFRRHVHTGRFTREARITTNIAHLSAARLKSVEFPIPPMEEQERLVSEASQVFEAHARLGAALATGRARGAALRRALLTAAFTGRLTGRSSDMDLAEELAEATT